MWLIGLLIIISLVAFVNHLIKRERFDNSGYADASDKQYYETMYNAGNFGEFQVFELLAKLQRQQKLLVNLYLPKRNGGTSEIDVVMIDRTGIYVFECKNFSGWVFGDEKNKNWAQIFKGGKKYQFYNPIWQNQGHINALKACLSLWDENKFKSYIVFGNRAILKRITINSPDVTIVLFESLASVLSVDLERSIPIMTQREVDIIYRQLSKYSKADDDVKHRHRMRKD